MRYLFLDDLIARYGAPRGRAAFREWVRRQELDRGFPARIYLSDRKPAWIEEDVLGWEAARPRGRRQSMSEPVAS